jgi:hypothetical protein
VVDLARRRWRSSGRRLGGGGLRRWGFRAKEVKGYGLRLYIVIFCRPVPSPVEPGSGPGRPVHGPVDRVPDRRPTGGLPVDVRSKIPGRPVRGPVDRAWNRPGRSVVRLNRAVDRKTEIFCKLTNFESESPKVTCA